MPLYIAKSGDLVSVTDASLTHSQIELLTQLLIKYKSGALVTQFLWRHPSLTLMILCNIDVNQVWTTCL